MSVAPRRAIRSRAFVRGFFDGCKYVTPDVNSENYAANFYGDTPDPKLCQRDVILCILVAWGTWECIGENGKNWGLMHLDTVMDQIFSELEHIKTTNKPGEIK